MNRNRRKLSMPDSALLNSFQVLKGFTSNKEQEQQQQQQNTTSSKNSHRNHVKIQRSYDLDKDEKIEPGLSLSLGETESGSVRKLRKHKPSFPLATVSLSSSHTTSNPNSPSPSPSPSQPRLAPTNLSPPPSSVFQAPKKRKGSPTLSRPITSSPSATASLTTSGSNPITMLTPPSPRKVEHGTGSRHRSSSSISGSSAINIAAALSPRKTFSSAPKKVPTIHSTTPATNSSSGGQISSIANSILSPRFSRPWFEKPASNPATPTGKKKQDEHEEAEKKSENQLKIQKFDIDMESDPKRENENPNRHGIETEKSEKGNRKARTSFQLQPKQVEDHLAAEKQKQTETDSELEMDVKKEIKNEIKTEVPSEVKIEAKSETKNETPSEKNESEAEIELVAEIEPEKDLENENDNENENENENETETETENETGIENQTDPHETDPNTDSSNSPKSNLPKAPKSILKKGGDSDKNKKKHKLQLDSNFVENPDKPANPRLLRRQQTCYIPKEDYAAILEQQLQEEKNENHKDQNKEQNNKEHSHSKDHNNHSDDSNEKRGVSLNIEGDDKTGTPSHNNHNSTSPNVAHSKGEGRMNKRGGGGGGGGGFNQRHMISKKPLTVSHPHATPPASSSSHPNPLPSSNSPTPVPNTTTPTPTFVPMSSPISPRSSSSTTSSSLSTSSTSHVTTHAQLSPTAAALMYYTGGSAIAGATGVTFPSSSPAHSSPPSSPSPSSPSSPFSPSPPLSPRALSPRALSPRAFSPTVSIPSLDSLIQTVRPPQVLLVLFYSELLSGYISCVNEVERELQRTDEFPNIFFARKDIHQEPKYYQSLDSSELPCLVCYRGGKMIEQQPFSSLFQNQLYLFLQRINHPPEEDKKTRRQKSRSIDLSALSRVTTGGGGGGGGSGTDRDGHVTTGFFPRNSNRNSFHHPDTDEPLRKVSVDMEGHSNINPANNNHNPSSTRFNKEMNNSSRLSLSGKFSLSSFVGKMNKRKESQSSLSAVSSSPAASSSIRIEGETQSPPFSSSPLSSSPVTTSPSSSFSTLPVTTTTPSSSSSFPSTQPLSSSSSIAISSSSTQSTPPFSSSLSLPPSCSSPTVVIATSKLRSTPPPSPPTSPRSSLSSSSSSSILSPRLAFLHSPRKNR